MSADLLSADPVVAPVEPTTNTTTTGTPSTSTTEPTISSSWLPTEYASEPSLKDFKDVSGLAKSYMSLNSERGRSVRIPGPDAGKEDLDKFYSRITSVKGVMRSPDQGDSEAMGQMYNSLGRPTESSGYEVDLGDDSKYLVNDNVETFKKVAHEVGLTTTQYKKMLEFDVSRNRQQTEVDQNAASSAVTLLQQRWGNEYNNRIAGARAAYRTYQSQFPEGFNELERVAKNNPALVAILSDIGRTMQEKGFIDAPHAYGGTTPEEALEKISEMRNNKEHPFHNIGAPGHNEAKATMTKYYKQAYPDKS